MAPEYLVEGRLTEKIDIYGFGVLVLEIISGVANSKFEPEDTFENLVGHVTLTIFLIHLYTLAYDLMSYVFIYNYTGLFSSWLLLLGMEAFPIKDYIRNHR